MAVQLAAREDDTNKIKINTISEKKVESMYRLKQELDQGFAEEYLKNRALEMGLGYVDLIGMPIDATHLAKVSKEDAVKYGMGVFRVDGTAVKVAVIEYNPSLQQPLIDKLEEKGYKLSYYLCSEESFAKLIKLYDGVLVHMINDDELRIDEGRMDKFFEEDLTMEGLTKTLEEADTMTVSDIFERLLAAAITNDASDIHFEPEKEDAVIRLRLDGILHDFGRLSRETEKKIESRVKFISGLKLNVNDIPQDGRFSFQAQGKSIDVRVSLLPSNYGYSIVMRLLGVGSVSLKLEALGFVGSAKTKMDREMQRSQGMILATGPTGSGKTTTLYTLLTSLNDGETKIITLEDPIEYKLNGITQTQISKPQATYDANGNLIMTEGYTFGSGLRSIMRQDPDVVMVGEIRDNETTEVSVDAALTGHKVLSTLHTNDAVGAIPRLMEMGAKGYALADAISLIVGQRLVRRLCENCKQPHNLSPEEQQLVTESLANLPIDHGYDIPQELTFYKAVGCEQCNYLGYKGRVGCYEVLTMTDGLRALLQSDNPSFVQMRQTAVQEGMITMLQDGVIKAVQGVTDIPEVLSIIG
jgi:type II secretory ATPase GspE/PulE/Tfp pilus assembly ATPase PilB-like protein